MPDFKYKTYSPEEDIIYSESIAKVRDAVGNGLSFNEACKTLEVEDISLKAFIVSDALKILIADLHYSRGISLPDVADKLKVSLKTLGITINEMLEDVGESAAQEYREMDPDGPIGHA
ncbi:MAG: hypothetical protein EPN22_15355 [Nitrospirae bacterium]|nr:MAG: hypothetical protein EPN22_15355 [Nitrospirota bacterium]